MREVDTFAYVSMLKGLVEEGHQVSMQVSGTSMTPFLGHRRDTIWFETPKRDLRVGDMVFYQRKDGRYVMHRICKIKDGRFCMVGDAQNWLEWPIERSQIFALVTQVQRKGAVLRPGDFWWEFFARVWIHLVPVRPLIMRLYGMGKQVIRK